MHVRVAPAAVLRELGQSTAIGALTLMAHFAEADGGRGVAWQIETFNAMRALWPAGTPVSLANSAAILRHPQTDFRKKIVYLGHRRFNDDAGIDQPRRADNLFNHLPLMRFFVV